MAAQQSYVVHTCQKCGDIGSEAHIYNDIAKKFVCFKCDALYHCKRHRFNDCEMNIITNIKEIILSRVLIAEHYALGIAIDIFLNLVTTKEQ